jgi:hypothetical protein
MWLLAHAIVGEHAAQCEAKIDYPGHQGQPIVVITIVWHLLPECAIRDVGEAATAG